MHRYLVVLYARRAGKQVKKKKIELDIILIRKI